jgi:CheY-like chemotaxis protein
MRVLVAHWQEDVVKLIEDHLPQCEVTCHTHGFAALASVRSANFDLVISSHYLPVVTGFEVLRNMRLHSPNLNTSAILLSEGNETPEHHRLAKQLNAAMLPINDVIKLKNLELWVS